MEFKKILNKKFDNKLFSYLFAFFAPILILLIIFLLKGINFDGERFAIGDMQAQYVDMIVYFKRLFEGGESLFYSITKGLGGDMFSTITYYMLSPINLIALLFSDGNIMQGIYLIILIKFGLCSLTMYTYLNYKNKENKLFSLIFAICYALMAYNINNYFCIMWFDAIYMAPLIMMGIEKLVHEKKVLQYIICLWATIMFNYYIGYMVCIFSVLYYTYLMILKYKWKDKKEIIDSVKRFITSSLLAGLSACIVYLPSIIDIMKTNRAGVNASITSIEGTINRLFIGSYGYDTFLSYYQPNLYCSCLVLMLLVAFFFNKKRTDKQKYVTASLLMIFVFSIFIPLLNLVWHGFSYPVGYNFRFSFLLCAFIIMLAFTEITNFNKIDRKARNAILVFALLLGIYNFGYNDTFYSWLSVGLIVLYALLLFAKKQIKNIFIILLVLAEVVINVYICFIPADNQVTHSSFIENICDNFDNDNTYRIAGYIYYGTNEVTVCGKSTTKGFYSTLNNNISEFYEDLNYINGLNYYEDNIYAPPVIASLLGVKYIYADKKINNYTLIKETDIYKRNSEMASEYRTTNYIYENKEALSFGYLIKGYDKRKTEDDTFSYQNRIIKSFSGNEKDILIRVKNGYNENLIDSKYIYIMALADNAQLTINGDEYQGIEPYKIHAFENNYDSNDIEIKLLDGNGNSIDQYNAYYLDLKQYMTAINNLKLHQLEDIVIDKNKISGNILASEDSTLVLSIPYEKGWTVYVDGKKTDYYSIYDIFLSIDLKEGQHTIELVYYPKSLLISLFVSLVSIALTVLYIVTYNHKDKTNEETKPKIITKKLVIEKPKSKKKVTKKLEK